MNNKLEDFLNNNKDEFDSYEPSEAMWQRIENRIENPEKKGGLLVSMGARKWMSAAAAVVIVAGAAFLFNTKEKITEPTIAKVQPVNDAVPDSNDLRKPGPQIAQLENKPDAAILSPIDITSPVLASHDNQLQNIATEELAHYTKLVELKQQQITILKKDEPLLYEQFAADFSKIDQEFTELKKQKSKHPNSEQLLEAMLHNLQMQSALLNRQLEIVKAINNNKKKRYEKTYNSSI